MRRLTEFEREIVRKIHESEVEEIDFSHLLWFDKNVDFIFKVSIEDRPNGDAYDINLYTKDSIEYHVQKSNELIKNYYKEVKRIYDALNLIYLLEENGLVYLDSSFFILREMYFPDIPERDIKESDINGIILNDKENTIYYSLLNKDINERDFNILVNTFFQPTAALEIYIQNDFRTEEQKVHDEEIDLNKQSLRIAKYSALYALLAVGASVVFSALTLAYTAYHDYRRDSLEDKRYLL